MLEKFGAWMASHSITTHTIAALFAAAVLAYSQVQQFHDLVLSIYSHIPSGVQQFIVAALALYSWYRLRTQMNQGSKENMLKQSAVNRVLPALLVCLLCATISAHAQAPTNSPQFTLNFNVLNGPLGSVGTDIAGTYAVTANALLRSDNLIFPAVNGSYFGGGIQYALPTCGLLAKTNLNCEKFQFYGTGSVGETRITVGSNPALDHIGAMVGGGANYDPTGTGKFVLNLFDVHVARFPGMASGAIAIASVGFNLGWGTNQGNATAKRLKRLKKEREKAKKLSLNTQ